MKKNKILSYVVGGVGDKKSNNGTQYYMQDRIYLLCDLTLSITTCFNPYYLVKENKERQMEDYKIRKLTPLECWRLMGFTDEEFKRAEKVNSNTQLYKQAGNSIVVDVLYYIFQAIFEPQDKEIKGQISIDDLRLT